MGACRLSNRRHEPNCKILKFFPGSLDRPVGCLIFFYKKCYR